MYPSPFFSPLVDGQLGRCMAVAATSVLPPWPRSVPITQCDSRRSAGVGMGMTSQERSRRFRYHRPGNHRYCDPAKCNGRDGPFTRGDALARGLRAERTLTAAEDALAVHAGAVLDLIEQVEAERSGEALAVRVREAAWAPSRSG
jgi:hypothetical protein